MKTFKRASLPDSIRYNKRTFILNAGKSARISLGEKFIDDGTRVKIEVLSANLKNRLDLHGKPYKPSVFIFKQVQH